MTDDPNPSDRTADAEPPTEVVVAAANSRSFEKRVADLVCTGENDEVVINEAIANFGTSNLNRFFYCGSSVTNASCATWTVLTDAAFKDSANGNYRPNSGGALINAGDMELYSSYATSVTDLDGARRIQGKGIDLGCWERDLRGTTLIVR